MFMLTLLDALARRQHGLITHSQLIELGFTRREIRVRVASGRLISVRRGVYRLCGAAATWNGAVLAAVFAAGEGAAASHVTAGAIWQIVDWTTDRIEITSRRYHRLEGVTSHRHDLSAREVTRYRQTPVTTVERTLLDLAETTEASLLGKAVDAALRRELTTLRRLEVVMDERAKPGRRRSRTLVQALAERGLGYDPGANDWELRMDRLWDELELPPAERQYRVRVGGRAYRVDRAIPSRRIAVEWNGYSSHGTRSSFDYDAERKAHLACAGWCVLEFTPVTPPSLIRNTVLAAYDERSHLEREAR